MNEKKAVSFIILQIESMFDFNRPANCKTQNNLKVLRCLWLKLFCYVLLLAIQPDLRILWFSI